MRRHDGTWQFDFPDEHNKIEIEREVYEAKLLRPICLGGIAWVTTPKYCGINSLRKELRKQRKSVLLWTLRSFTFTYIQ
jgi:hypothetical protein